MAGQFSGQVSSPAVIAVAHTSTSSSPGPGSGMGMVWLVRLAGSEFDAHMASIERTASSMAVSFPWSGSFAGSAADLRGRLHSLFPAPGQVHRALGFRIHGLDDLAVVAEVLDGAGDLDVHHARLVADGAPSVEGARGLVDVVAGPDALAGTEDLAGSGEVEGMDVAGMAVHRDRAARLEPHQLGPAVRGEAQRAERLARAGRDPRHAVGVERPGRLERHGAHSFPPMSAIHPRYGRIGLRPRSNHIRIPLAKQAVAGRRTSIIP